MIKMTSLEELMKRQDINKECHQIWEELGPWWDTSVDLNRSRYGNEWF